MLIKRKELRCPKLVLSHIRSDNGVLKAVIDRLQNGLGRKGGGLHAQGMLLLPALKLRQPFPGRKRLCLFQQGGDCAFCISHNRNIYGNVPGNGSGVNIDVDNGSFSGKSFGPSGNAVVEPGSDGEKQITFAYGQISGKASVYADISHIQAVAGGNGALSHDGGNDGNPCQFGKPGHFPAGPRDIDAAAHQEKGAGGAVQKLQRFAQLTDVYRRLRPVSADFHGVGIAVTAQRLLDILGDIYQYNARFSCGGNVKGLFDDAAKLFAAAYRYGIFCNAPCNAHNIHLLKGIVSYQPGGNLPGKAYERDTVIVGGGDSRYKIGGSRPAGHQTYSCFPGRTRIAVRSVYQTLFMAGQDNLRYSSIQRVE